MEKEIIKKETILIYILYLISFFSLTLILDSNFVFKYISNIEEIYKITISMITTIIAVFITIYIFKIQYLDNQINNSEDEEGKKIYRQEQKDIYEYFIKLGIYVIVAILINLICILNKVNGSKLDLFLLLIYSFVIAILSKYTCQLITKLINPKFIQQTANRLIKEDIKVEPEKEQLSIGQFIEKYIKFETIINEEYNKYYNKYNKYINNIPFREKFKRVMNISNNYLELENHYKEIEDLIKYRNYVVHGKIDNINKDIYDNLENILMNIERNKNMKYFTTQELLNLRESGCYISVRGYNNIDEILQQENIFCFISKSESGIVNNYNLTKLEVEVINRKQCLKILEYLKLNNNIDRVKIEEELNINFDVNDSINALLEKGYIKKDKNDIYILTDKGNGYIYTINNSTDLIDLNI